MRTSYYTTNLNTDFHVQQVLPHLTGELRYNPLLNTHVLMGRIRVLGVAESQVQAFLFR